MASSLPIPLNFSFPPLLTTCATQQPEIVDVQRLLLIDFNSINPLCNILFLDQYRVKVEQSCTGSTPYNGDYLLKVYDDMIKLFTPNGIIHTKFSFLIKDIYEIKYQISDTMQKFVTLSVKSVLTE